MAKIYLSPSSQTNNKWTDGTTEAQRAQEFSNLIKIALQQAGHQVYGSDNTKFGSDNNANRRARINEANNIGVDAYVAIHSNAGAGGKGPEVLYKNGSSKGNQLASAIESRLKKLYGSSRGIKTNETEETSKSKAPSSLVEIAFHDKDSDVKWMKNNKNAIADAIASAICSYLH